MTLFSHWRSLTFFAITIGVLSILSAWGGPPAPPRLTFMTWNIYAGGDFENILAEGSIANAMGDLFESVENTDFQSRAQSIASEVDEHRPHLIGLQEVATWRAEPFFGSDDITYDFLDILQEELLARGLHYDVVETLTTLDFEAPGIVDGDPMDIRWTERIAVLAKHSAALQISNVRTRRFHDTYSISLPVIGEIEFQRGWIQANVDFQDRRIRFVNTHLESLSSEVRLAQAIDLAERAGATALPIVIVGDFNAVAGQAPYAALTTEDFVDAWAEQHTVFSGPTCCQDGDLLNGASSLELRLDLAWYRGDFTVVSAKRAGHQQVDRTPSGLWPSDHAGVVTRLELE